MMWTKRADRPTSTIGQRPSHPSPSRPSRGGQFAPSLSTLALGFARTDDGEDSVT